MNRIKIRFGNCFLPACNSVGNFPKGPTASIFIVTIPFICDQTRFKEGDEIILLTHVGNLADLNDRWEPTQVVGEQSKSKH